jgi:hypothetical protein
VSVQLIVTVRHEPLDILQQPVLLRQLRMLRIHQSQLLFTLRSPFSLALCNRL